MTWQSFVNFSSMPHRHLIFSYMVVLVIQGGYFASIVWNWRQTKRPHH
jgi:hypothetical protein